MKKKEMFKNDLIEFFNSFSNQNITKVSIVEDYGGICYPAHIDRESNGIIAILGAMPEKPKFPIQSIVNI